tara:strand:+ start:166 stop:318 length:153 start_codon:yes stop_codon:yes gene_type:complete
MLAALVHQIQVLPLVQVMLEVVAAAQELLVKLVLIQANLLLKMGVTAVMV